MKSLKTVASNTTISSIEVGSWQSPLESLTSTEYYQPEEFQGIVEVEKQVKKNWRGILSCSTPSSAVRERMTKEMRVNCLKKGNIQKTEEKRIHMLCVDGTKSSYRMLEIALQGGTILDVDHVILICAFNTFKFTSDEKSNIIVNHKLWEAASSIIRGYEEKLKELRPKLDYSLLVPGWEESRIVIICMAEKYLADTIWVGKHLGRESRKNKCHFTRFHTFVKQCIVLRYMKCKLIVS